MKRESTDKLRLCRLRAPSSLSGFTLIELMVVLAVIGIMTAAILPEMRGTFGDALLRSASRDLVGVCGIAASRAVSFNAPHRIRLDPRNGRFALEKRVGSAEGQPLFAPVRDVPGAEGTIDSRITLQLQPSAGESTPAARKEEADPSEPAVPTSRDALGFYPDGTADDAEIVLRDRDGFGIALRVNPVTARIRILPLERRGH